MVPVREAILLWKRLLDFGYKPNTLIVIYGDNQAALVLLRDRRLTSLSNHLMEGPAMNRVWFTQAKYVKSQENWADVHTKA